MGENVERDTTDDSNEKRWKSMFLKGLCDNSNILVIGFYFIIIFLMDRSL